MDPLSNMKVETTVRIAGWIDWCNILLSRLIFITIDIYEWLKMWIRNHSINHLCLLIRTFDKKCINIKIKKLVSIKWNILSSLYSSTFSTFSLFTSKSLLSWSNIFLIYGHVINIFRRKKNVLISWLKHTVH